ncbi:uncharacterized protein MELLADRAFT_124048 [Melampsora larici-populina 98AG31]|uniref:Secreted protein n=1 Tax=Melampsora larici-populina (strain 98AG31 / pathotype 3-4-7) TaxID=747676 RepID=F4RIW7_MELLP|nr:uncharacterized protein MELLADRAFT_124048 [Melampsora larici-populina 98AG31]EGG07760.1 secreted protein [Melampsora larici-populina 98AG31]
MNPSLLYHSLFEILLIYVLPIILLFFIVHLLFPKKFRLVVIIGVMILAFLPSEATFIICLFLLIFSILAGFLAFCFFANKIINFDLGFDDFPPSSIPIVIATPPIPVIVITPPTKPHVTNLPPGYYQQDPAFLMVIRKSIRTKRKSKTRPRPGPRPSAPNGRPGSRWMALFYVFLNTLFHGIRWVFS